MFVWLEDIVPLNVAVPRDAVSADIDTINHFVRSIT